MAKLIILSLISLSSMFMVVYGMYMYGSTPMLGYGYGGGMMGGMGMGGGIMGFLTFSKYNATCINRKEDNDQESIQFTNTFHSKTPKGKKDALKATTPQL